ncbi:MAG: hypothetical protein L3K19_09315 [Thermoplasmata archaeon]|nr:hypothetical protein [Thermoplasmata archaeon]
MGAGSHAIPSGVVLGLVAVLLGQQFSYIDLSGTYGGIIDLVIGAVVGGILAGFLGRALGRRAERRRGAQAWTPPETEPKK